MVGDALRDVLGLRLRQCRGRRRDPDCSPDKEEHLAGPLQGIRVVDFTHFQAGSVCSLILADMGAEVIKVEPLIGDDGRRGHYPAPHGESLYFQVHNRNKLSLTLDIRTPEGKEVLRDLVKTSDVFVENYRPGVLQRLGFGYEALRKMHPSIVMTSVSGFGQYGPYSHWPAHDMILHAMSGIMSLNGQPGSPPTRVGVAIADYGGGIFGALGTASALYRRSITGQGEHVDVAMLDALLFQLDTNPMCYKYNGDLYSRTGNRFPGSGPCGYYPCKDGGVYLIASADWRWKGLSQMIGRPEMGEDSQYARNIDRFEHQDEIDPVIEAWTRQRSVGEVLKAAEEHEVIAGPVLDLPQVLENEHGKARQMFVEMEHPLAGKLTYPGAVVKMRNNPPEVKRPGPLLGEHNGYVLSELLGYATGRLRELEDKEIVHAKAPSALPHEE